MQCHISEVNIIWHKLDSQCRTADDHVITVRSIRALEVACTLPGKYQTTKGWSIEPETSSAFIFNRRKLIYS